MLTMKGESTNINKWKNEFDELTMKITGVMGKSIEHLSLMMILDLFLVVCQICQVGSSVLFTGVLRYFYGAWI